MFKTYNKENNTYITFAASNRFNQHFHNKSLYFIRIFMPTGTIALT